LTTTENPALRCAGILAALAELAHRFQICAHWRDECDGLVTGLGRATGVDRAALWRNHPEGGGELRATILSEWAAPGVPGRRHTLSGEGFPWQASGFGRWAAILARGDVLVERAAEMPSGERDAALAHGAASVCEVPIRVAAGWWGQLSLSAVDEERLFLPCEVDGARVADATFGTAVERGLAAERPGADPPRPVAPAAPPLATIMLVEDEPLVLRFVERLLERAGYAVVSAATPLEARQLAATMPAPDLLVTDVVLPGGSGLDLAAELRSLWPALRVLYVSGYPGDAFPHHDLQPSDLLLRKPFRSSELFDAIAGTLG